MMKLGLDSVSPPPFTDCDLCITESSGGIRGDHRQRRETDEQRLLNRLLDNYDSRTRPVMNASTPVRVRVGLTLNQIFDVVSMHLC